MIITQQGLNASTGKNIKNYQLLENKSIKNTVAFVTKKTIVKSVKFSKENLFPINSINQINQIPNRFLFSLWKKLILRSYTLETANNI